MGEDKPRYFVIKPGRGGVPRYFWQPSEDLRAAGWKSRRLDDNKTTAMQQAIAFNEELDAARLARPATLPAPRKPAGPTVDDLIATFKASRFWVGKRGRGRPVLADKTKYEYGRYLDILSEWAGPEAMKSITVERVNKKLYEPLQKVTPAEANALMRTGRLLWNRGRVLLNFTGDNPFASLGMIGLDKTGNIWPAAAVTAMVAKADALGHHGLGTFITFEDWIGQRPADALRLPRKPHRGDDFVVRQNKTGAVVTLPVTMVPHLVARAAAELANQQTLNITATTLIVNEKTKQPYTEDQLRRDFMDVRAALAKETPKFEADFIAAGADPEDPDSYTIATGDLLLKDLRHTAVTRLGESGSEVGELISITGHTPASAKRILETYLRRTAPAARQAFAKRLAFERRQGGER